MSQLWETSKTTIGFGPAWRTNQTNFSAVKLTLKSNPSIELLIYELPNGINISNLSKIHTSIIPKNSIPVLRNYAFVEAVCNPAIDKTQGMIKARKEAETACRKQIMLPETLEVFNVHLDKYTGLLAKIKRLHRVQMMKGVIKELGDMTESEVLEIWREARCEEVSDS